MAGIGIAAAIGFVFALSSLGNTLVPDNPISQFGDEVFKNNTGISTFALTSTQTLKKFSSIDELQNFLLNVEGSRSQFRTFAGGGDASFREGGLTLEDSNQSTTPTAPSPQGAPASQTLDSELKTTIQDPDYSTTNVQVQGVDEPDFVKNDGKYAYILSGDRLTIVDAYPAENASVTVKVALDIQEGQYLQNMFLNNNTLVVFYQEYGEDFVIQEYDFAPQPVYSPKTHALVMDVSDSEDPTVVSDYEITGTYNNARMIGQRVYVVTTSDLYDYHHPIVPKVMESSRIVVSPDIYYFDNPEQYYSFNTITSIDINAEEGDQKPVDSQTYMMSPGSTLYVSEDNIYIAYQKNLPYNYYETQSKDRFFEVVVPLLPSSVQSQIRSIEANPDLTPSEKWDRVSELLQDTYNSMSEGERNALFQKIQNALAEHDAEIQKQAQKTVIHKISISEDGLLNYSARGEVPGRLLNQFSMDEHEDRFRVTTTSEFWSPHLGSARHNNVYVLNEDMETVGSLEEIAKDESIYAARFMGDRLYLVTFEQIDPFFVIDLSQDDPEVLGELKLPGFSNYLHPYDETHVIGIGREVENGQFKGVKLALFDVSDVENPKAVDVYEIGGPGTDSEVLYDHKALLFDRSKNVLSIPVSIMPDYGQPMPFEGGRYVEPKVWRGFYVFGVDPEQGFDLKGRVEHFNDTGDYYYSYGVQGSRSFYIGDVLYTVTLNNLIKMNDLESLDEINELDIGSTGGILKSPSQAKAENSTVAQ